MLEPGLGNDDLALHAHRFVIFADIGVSPLFGELVGEGVVLRQVARSERLDARRQLNIRLVRRLGGVERDVTRLEADLKSKK